MSDSLVYELSTSAGELENVFISREIVTVNDNNNNNYSSTNLQIDLASISSTQKFASWREAVIQVPLVISVRKTTDTGNLGNIDNVEISKLLTLKSNSAHIFHSMQVSVNNTEVVQITDFSSIPMTFKALTSQSLNDQEKLGNTLFMYKDSPDQWTYGGNMAGSAGPFVQNNNNTTNEGFAKRLAWTDETVPSENTQGLNDIMTDSKYSQMALGAWDSHVAGTTYRTLRFMVQIPLVALHDFFEQCPLMKGAYLRFKFVLNQCTIDFTADDAKTNGSFFDDVVVNVNSGGICPIALNTGFTNTSDVLVDAGTYRVALGVVRSYDSQVPVTSSPLSAVQVTVPTYLLDASKYAQYEALGEDREISYSDYMRPTIPALAGGASSTTILSTGINRLRSVLLCPLYASTSNGGILSYQNPLSSSPTTCDPYAMFSTYNLLLSGAQLYQQDQQYAYQFFQNEIMELGVNSWLTRGITSSLISQEDWNNIYGFVYTNTKRRLGPAYESATSVSVKIQSAVKLALDIQAFLEYERKLIINVFSGQVKASM